MSSLEHQTPASTENPNVNAEQMATLSEGKVADAVEQKYGVQKFPGETVKMDDYASDLDRKKAEQAEARKAIRSQRRAGEDVDGSLGRGRERTEDNSDV